MSIAQALSSSLSGLHATQAGLSLVASNVANAQTPGYIRKSLSLAATAAGGIGGGVRVITVNRELDQYIQRQLRVETSGGAYADLRASFYRRLQQLYGEPGSQSALETVFNNFTNAVQALVTSPDSPAARSVVLSSAQVFAQTLNGITTDLQALRGDAENGLANAVATANNAMRKISELNAQLGSGTTSGAADAALQDQRDSYIDQLARLMDIRVVVGDHNQISVFTNSGIQLVGSGLSQLSFNAQGTVSAATQWDADPAKSTLGTLSLVSPTGASVDLIASQAIRSGEIAALIDMRDNILVQAQAQLDAFAAVMARAFSDETVAGSAVTVGAQAGFDIDTTGLLGGDSISLTYTDVLTSTQHRVTIVRVDDASVLPLSNALTAEPNDEVVGIDFSGGMASVVAQLNAQFGGQLTFSNPFGASLRILDDGAPNTSDVDAVSLTRTTTSLSGGSAALGLFTDGSNPYSGALAAGGNQNTGLAGRIAVNPALLLDASKLVLYGAGVAAGDPTRPDFIYQRLTEATFMFQPQVGFGTAASPFSGSLPAFLRQTLTVQGEAAANARSLADGQRVVVNALQARMAEKSGVNVDQEMANLIALQTAYGANARVMSTIREMLELLMQI
jgi:flagellar hook-associated protein 1 FlgK